MEKTAFFSQKKKVKKLFLLLAMALSSVSLSAQREPMTPEVNRRLDAYVRYVNTCAAALDDMRRDFERLNLSANTFADGEKASFDFAGASPLDNRARYPKHPDALYQDCFEGSELFPPLQRGELNLQVGKFKTTFDEIASTHRALLDYHANGKYREEPKLDFLYAKLQRMEVLFFDIQILQVKLGWAISDVRRAYLPAEGAGLVGLVRLDELADAARSVFKALYDRRETDLQAGRNRLGGLLAALTAQKSGLLPPEGALPESDRTALASQLDLVLARARDWKSQLDRCLAPGWTPPCPPVYDPQYCLHNDVLLPLYNDPLAGVVPLLNAYRHIGGWAVGDLMLQSPVFSRVLPKFMRAEERPPLTPEELERIIEQKRRRGADTVAVVPPVPPGPQIGDPTLEGFAANNLIFLLDVSASMARPEKLPLLQRSIEQLLPLMRPEDFVSLIVYSGEARVVLPPTSAARKETILGAVRALAGVGGSDVEKGLLLAYATAEEHFVAGGNNRIVLATDGEFSLDSRVRRAIKRGNEQGIALSVYFFGATEYPSLRERLEEMSRLGSGRYCHVKADNAEKTLLIEAQSVRQK